MVVGVRRGSRVVVVLLSAALAASCTFVSRSEPAPTGPDVTVVPAGATSYDLISQALDAGEIDEQEALQHRVLVQFGDPRVPERFIGESGGHDPGALAAAARDLDALRPEVRDAVRPYLLRPTDPESAFAGGGPVSGTQAYQARAATPSTTRTGTTSSSSPTDAAASPAGAASSGHVVALAGAVRSAPAEPDRQACGAWETLSLDPLPFRLWSCLGEDPAAAPEEPEVFTTFDPDGALADDIRELLHRMLRERPHGLGPPIPDRPFAGRHLWEDDSIDIYLLGKGWLAPARRGGQEHLLPNDMGLTVTTDPRRAGASSAYVLIDQDLVHDPATFLPVLAHEVFHVQQYSRARDVPDGARWFYEATATWAQAHYVPEHSPRVHDVNLWYMQDSPESLDVPHGHHPYAAYLWPLFMQQESDTGPDAVFDVWDQVAGQEGPALAEAIMDGIEAHLPFSSTYGEFVMRVFNATLPGDPITTRFVHVDPKFPDGYRPDLAELGRTHALDDDPLVIDYHEAGDGVGPLSHRYDAITVALPEEDSFGVHVMPDPDLAAAPGAHLEALVQNAQGEYRRHPVDLRDGAQLCRAQEVILVLANTSRVEPLVGTVELTRSEAPECTVAGGLTWQLTGDYASPATQLPRPTRASVHLRGSLDVVTGPGQVRKLWHGMEVDPSFDPPAEFRHALEEVLYFPDAGSTWSLDGRYVHESCVRGEPTTCPLRTVQELHAPPGPVEDLEITVVDGVPVLTAQLPVTVTTDYEGRMHRVDEEVWTLRCFTRGSWWEYGGYYRYMGESQLPSAPLSGTWTDGSRTAIRFDCDHRWEPEPAPGGSSTAHFSITGEVALRSR